MGISLTGLASQLDTAQMVKDLMSIERIPYTNLATKKSNLQKEQTIFRNINTAFRSLETALNNLRYASDWNQLKGVSSNTGAVQISTNSKATAGQYDINVTQLATKNTVQIDATYLFNNIGPNDTVKIGDHEINANEFLISNIEEEDNPVFDPVASLNKLAAIINQNSSAETNSSNATASVIKTSSTGDYKLVLNSMQSGASADNKVSFTVGGTNIIENSVIDPDNPVPPDVINTAGRDAILTINGVTVTRGSNTIEDLVEGATFTLTSTGTSSVEVGQDTDAIVSKVKEFVTAYNNLIGMVKDNLKKPDGEGVMNPLQGDALLRQINDQLYNVFNSGVALEGAATNTASGDPVRSFMEHIGLSIDKGVKSGSLMTGKITFDEEVFKNALADDPAKVIEMFTQKEIELDNGKKSAGIITQFSAIMNNYTSTVNGLLSNKVTGYDSEIKFIDQRMEAMSRSLEMKEARLKLQFSTMETMLSSLQNEQKWLSSQFDALLKSNSK